MSVTGSPPTRHESGDSTSAKGYLFGDYTFRTPMRLNEFFTDFNTYEAGDWTVITSSSGTNALADYNGGALTVTADTGASDVQGLQLVKKSFAFTSGSQVWFAINLSITDALNPQFLAGLSNDFSALAPTDGVYFSKAAASRQLNLVIRASSTSTTLAVGTFANATAYTLGFYYDGKPTPTLAVFSTIGMTAPTAFSQPYFSGGNQEVISASSETGATNTLVNLPTPTTLLTAGMALKSGGATNGGIGIIDYFLASEEIVGRF